MFGRGRPIAGRGCGSGSIRGPGWGAVEPVVRLGARPTCVGSKIMGCQTPRATGTSIRSCVSNCRGFAARCCDLASWCRIAETFAGAGLGCVSQAADGNPAERQPDDDTSHAGEVRDREHGRPSDFRLDGALIGVSSAACGGEAGCSAANGIGFGSARVDAGAYGVAMGSSYTGLAESSAARRRAGARRTSQAPRRKSPAVPTPRAWTSSPSAAERAASDSAARTAPARGGRWRAGSSRPTKRRRIRQNESFSASLVEVILSAKNLSVRWRSFSRLGSLRMTCDMGSLRPTEISRASFSASLRRASIRGRMRALRRVGRVHRMRVVLIPGRGRGIRRRRRRRLFRGSCWPCGGSLIAVRQRDVDVGFAFAAMGDEAFLLHDLQEAEHGGVGELIVAALLAPAFMASARSRTVASPRSQRTLRLRALDRSAA